MLIGLYTALCAIALFVDAGRHGHHFADFRAGSEPEFHAGAAWPAFCAGRRMSVADCNALHNRLFARRGRENQTRFMFFYAVAIHAAMGIALSGNLLTLFVFYEILTFSTYPLVTHKGTEDAKKAGRVYLGILVASSVILLLFGVITVWVLPAR